MAIPDMTQLIQLLGLEVIHMTNEEKCNFVCGATSFGTYENPDLGIRRLRLIDGGTGVNFEQLLEELRLIGDVDMSEFSGIELDHVAHFFYDEKKLSENEKILQKRIEKYYENLFETKNPSPGCYPPGILLASTWNRDLIYQVGQALGLEAAKYEIDVLLGTPNVNLLRDPRCGRFFEGYSEDPYLAGKLASGLISGVQSKGIAANVKHFAANNLEINRINIDETISKRALYEMYFPQFKDCVDEGVMTVMLAYVAINGKYCTKNSWLIKEVLRKEWGFDGLTLSDWGACKQPIGECIEAGNNLVMPYDEGNKDIINQLSNGIMSQACLDSACDRITNTISLIDSAYFKSKRIEAKNTPYDEYVRIGNDIAYRAACEGIVMLINKDKAMPAPKGSTFAIYDSQDGKLLDCGSGSAQVFTSRHYSLVDFLPNCTLATDVTSTSDYSLVIASISSREGDDRMSLELDESTKSILDDLSSGSKRTKIVLILNAPGPVILGEYEGLLDAMFCVYYPGMQGVKALADIIMGQVNPSGKLSVTFPKRVEDIPSFLCYPDGSTANYGEGIYVGYRGYEKRQIPSAFSFGFGLSYSHFSIMNVSLDKEEYRLSDNHIEVSLDISNYSDVDGFETVQVYIGDEDSTVGKPLRELRAFEKVFVPANSVRKICLRIRLNSLRSFDENWGKMLIEDGAYVLYVGDSLDNAKKAASFYLLEGSEEYLLGRNTEVRILQKHKDLYAWIDKELEEREMDTLPFIFSTRYASHLRLADLYSSDESFLKNFDEVARQYRKP